MIKEETGTVISVDKEYVAVRVDAAAECSSCGMCSGGSSGNISCSNYPGVKKGDRVKIRINTSGGFLSALFTFFLPAFLLVIFLSVGEVIAKEIKVSNAATVKSVFLFFGLLAGGMSMYFGNMFLKKRPKYNPEIICRMDSADNKKKELEGRR
ncbi:MAG: SoxR reducing system RseC family protein [bacterium]|nr:SoxR reducing system RseC family protein [bacterium]